MKLQFGNPLRSRYEILEKLGEGGMGVVYKARDLRLSRVVALKFLKGDGERGLTEARAIASLNHPHIATIYEISESKNASVLVLEYLAGETLRSRLKGAPLTVADVLRYGVQIAEGLAYAHSHGLAHGDVKPENLMFTEDGHLKITDFGLARLFRPMASSAHTITLNGKISGTPKYLAPECFEGWPADCRTDVYSLGVVLEEMAGMREVPEAFRNVITCASARERSQRFQNMEDLAAVLRRIEEVPEAELCENPTVLVIEDDQDLRSTLDMSLSHEGYRVLTAASGREGIRLAREKSPEMVLLDVMLPGLSGFDVCRELRGAGFQGSIMMVTGRTEEVDRVV